MASGALLQTLEGHGGSVVAVTPDNRVVSVSDNGTRRVWKLLAQGRWCTSRKAPSGIHALSPRGGNRFSVIERSADGKRYIVGVWNAELQRLQELKDDGKSSFLPHLRELPSR